MSILVLVGRAYIIDRLEFGAIADDAGQTLIHVVTRTVLLLSFYWPLRALIGRRVAGPY
jgi:hypothetical protein